jgi:hypothetical protein
MDGERKRTAEHLNSEGLSDQRKFARLETPTVQMQMQNGVTKDMEHCNGNTLSNDEETLLGSRVSFRKSEYIRLLEQALVQLGHPDLALRLQTESKVSLEAPDVQALREAIQRGDYDNAVALLGTLPLGGDEECREAQFLVLEHKYLEVGAYAFLKRGKCVFSRKCSERPAFLTATGNPM